MDLFTQTDSEFQKTRVRDACEGVRDMKAVKAPGRGGVAELVELVERMAAERKSVNQILAAVRAFNALPATAPADSVWIALDAPGWREWEAFYRANKGKTPPQDRRGGWRFPSRFPPSLQAAE